MGENGLFKKSVLGRLDVSLILGVFLKKMFFPKVVQKGPGGVWDHPRPIPAYSGPILDHFGPKSPKNLYINILIYIYIYIYIPIDPYRSL